MEWNLMAVAAFVLFFIYDWNSIHRKNRVVQRFFGLGTAVLAVSAVVLCPIWDFGQNVSITAVKNVWRESQNIRSRK